eukprot:2681097-Prymnesium_polylepis.1
MGPGDPHGDRKGATNMFALQRMLVLGGFMSIPDDLEPLAANASYTEIHRNDARVLQKEFHAWAKRILHSAHVPALRHLDENDGRRPISLGSSR